MSAGAAGGAPRATFFRVTLFAALVLLTEAVLFNVILYLHDFFTATAVISYAVLGIGLGAFAASRLRVSESLLFFACSVGTAAGLYAAALLLVRYPVAPAIVAAVAGCVFFPVLYIGVLFREHPGRRVYLFDMAGAGLGVVVTVALYAFLTSESIVLLLATVVPALGVACYWRDRDAPRRRKLLIGLAGAPIVLIGLALFVVQVATDSFNLFRLFDRDAQYAVPKIFKTKDPDQLAATYDGLVGRIDVLKPTARRVWTVCYNGWPNDHFQRGTQRTHADEERAGVRWPSDDLRVFYGMRDDPRVYIIGSAARGITATVKRLTPARRIFPVEINPGIVEIMQRDFYKESGRAYRGLKPVVGNALALLRGMDRKFDVITLINTHSGRNVGDHAAGPDYLHTLEHYGLYLDRLGADGYVLFEERPFNRGGELGFYRMLHTMWHALAADGAADPSAHFFIWEWNAGKAPARLTKEIVPATGQYAQANTWYLGMIVSKRPLVGPRREKALAWFFEAAAAQGRAVYLKGALEHGEVPAVIAAIERDDFSTLAAEGFDASVATNDRPFAFIAVAATPEVLRLLRISAAICGALLLLFAAGAFYRAPPGRIALLCGFNVLIGFGYFFIEIMLMQVYQNVFVSAGWSLVLVLGVLLVSSGLGGYFAHRVRTWQATALLIPTAVAAIYLPSLLIDVGAPGWLGKGLSVVLIAATGALLGVYFPRGLALADGWGLGWKVPTLFAINSVAGAFAVMLALYSGIHLGYQTTVIVAALFYCCAGLLLRVAAKG